MRFSIGALLAWAWEVALTKSKKTFLITGRPLLNILKFIFSSIITHPYPLSQRCYKIVIVISLHVGAQEALIGGMTKKASSVAETALVEAPGSARTSMAASLF